MKFYLALKELDAHSHKKPQEWKMKQLPPLSTCQALPEYRIHSGLYNSRAGSDWEGPKEVTEIFKGLFNLPHEERLKALGFFSLGKVQWETHYSFPVLKKGEGSLITRSRTEDKRQQLQVALEEVSSQENLLQ